MVADLDTARAREVAGDGVKVVGDAREVIANPDIDIVIELIGGYGIARQLVLEAIAAGKHVVCEKPFARDADEGYRMWQAAEAAGVVHQLGCEFRWATGQALAARALAEGVIGTPRLATFLFHMPSLAEPDAGVPDWWRSEAEGGGWLGAYCSHLIDQIRVSAGEFTGVSASLQGVAERVEATPWTAEDAYTIHFRTESGLEGMLQSTAAARGPFAACTRFVGSRGTLWIEGDTVGVADASGERTLEIPEDLRLPAPDPPPAELLSTAYDMLHSMGIDLGPYTRLYEAFRDRIQGNPVATDPRPPTFEDGFAVQKVLDAVRRASREKAWVAID